MHRQGRYSGQGEQRGSFQQPFRSREGERSYEEERRQNRDYGSEYEDQGSAQGDDSSAEEPYWRSRRSSREWSGEDDPRGHLGRTPLSGQGYGPTRQASWSHESGFQGRSEGQSGRQGFAGHEQRSSYSHSRGPGGLSERQPGYPNQWESSSRYPGHQTTPFERGKHFGKAPRGYTRSDERIREEICDRLMLGEIDPSNITVKVERGEVTLEGTIDSRQSKYRVEELVASSLGVQDINNGLRVKRSEAAEFPEPPEVASQTSLKAGKNVQGSPPNRVGDSGRST